MPTPNDSYVKAKNYLLISCRRVCNDVSRCVWIAVLIRRPARKSFTIRQHSRRNVPTGHPTKPSIRSGNRCRTLGLVGFEVFQSTRVIGRRSCGLAGRRVGPSSVSGIASPVMAAMCVVVASGLRDGTNEFWRPRLRSVQRATPCSGECSTYRYRSPLACV